MGTDDFERMKWSWYYHHTVQTPSAVSAKALKPGKMGNPKDDLMPINDPVNPQPQSKNPNNTSEDIASQQRPSSVGNVSHQQASGDATGKDDPVNPQEPTSKADVNDPVYAQPQTSPPASQGASHTTASGNAVTTDDPTYTQQHGSASSRLQQVTSHISPSSSEPSPANTRRTRKKARDVVDTLPEDYSDIIAHITTMKHLASTPDTTSRGYIRQKAAGKLWARERISHLLDPSTWREVGALSGSTTWRQDPHNPRAEHVSSFLPTNNPQGFGQLTCPLTGQRREIYLTVDDFSLRAGHADGGNTLKTLYGEKLALKLKTPVVKLCDGSSGGGSVTTITKQGYAYLPHNIILWPAALQLNAGIPNLGAVLGSAIGLGFARVVSTHFSVMAADIGSCFNAGPKVVEGATFEEGLSFQELGGPMVHCTNGTIDNMAADEEGCFVQIRTVLGYLPDCGEIQAPPCSPCADDVNREDVGLRSIIPRRKERGYNPRAVIGSVVDKGSWFEIGQLWGRTSIVGLARLGGRPIGVVSNNCEVNSGALDPAGSQKMMKHLKFCDVFNLPILQFVDCRKFCSCHVMRVMN